MECRVLWLLIVSATVCFAWMDERPVLESVDGNLIIWSAKDKNVTIKTLGSGYLTVNDIDLVESARTASRAARLVDGWRNGYMQDLQNRVQRLVTAVEGPRGLQRRLDALWWGNDGSNSTSPRPDRPGNAEGVDEATKVTVRDLTGRVRRLESRVRTIMGKLRANQCVSNPCQNGGTCIKIYDGYQCICPSNWQGPSCSIDVDECLQYAGTNLGCQNGATCSNTAGSYTCACAPGWFGLHCASKTSICNAQDSEELCGNGYCVEQKGTPLGYACICKKGWKAEGANPACTVDINECTEDHLACSKQPRVECINVPGTYHCGPCPAGYTGNGYYCSDVDECLVNNGGCSTVPKVQCHNQIGSRVCGPCPPGYQGDGVTCTFVGTCRINNGGCHPLATCIENLGLTSGLPPDCRCPPGYEGSGMGPMGCVPSRQPFNACASNPCLHGTCSPQGDSFFCRCDAGYAGSTCSTPVNPCLPNPCKNSGICTTTSYRTFTCDCTAAYKGARCEIPKDECGGIFRDPVGSLSYPSNGGLYPNDKTCVFIFITNNSLVLNVTFTRFRLEDTPKCRHDFLQIHDGGYAGTHQIGRFCGNKLPRGGNFISTHNTLYMWLNTDSSKVDEGFAFEWNSIPPVCGGLLEQEYGTISSPGSPGNYAVNRDCIWEISVPSGKRIQFHFFTVLIEEHPTCGKDYLEINETMSDRQVRLGVYCNHTHPPPLLTSGSTATVHFHSDDKGQDVGFQLSYSAVEGTPGCGGVHTAAQGTISSPREEETYQPDLYCEWKIQLPVGEKIRLTWVSLDIEASATCYYDYVVVYEGADVNSPEVGKYCGSDLPAARTLDSNVALIIFKSDWSHQQRGFTLKYTTHCGGEFHESSGVLTSPYYPNKYPVNKICQYEIIQPAGKGIALNIIDMDIEGHSFQDCYFDYLQIYDGDNENATKLAELCGDLDNVPAEPFYSTYNVMSLVFRTDGSYQHRGFMANYTAIDRRCGGFFKTPTGTIRSPGGDEEYDNNEECLWTIQAPPGHVIQLSWSFFNLEHHEQCGTDFVKVTEEYNGEDTVIGKYCGNKKPPTVTTQGRTMTIKFISDSTITAEGFVAEYAFVDVSKVCGGNYFSSTGYIRSPNYPDRYPANKECVWVIEAPNKMQIKLNIEKFHLEHQTRCIFDFLEIRNGGHETSPLIGKYCGQKIPQTIQSLTNQIYLKFVADSSRSGEGFSIQWDSSEQGCGGTLSGTMGDIMSPYYPAVYADSSDCTWTIAVAAGSRVQVVFVDLDLEHHPRCRFDYLEIAEGAHGALKDKHRYCGADYPTSMEFNSNLVTVKFRSDFTNSGRGFHIKYNTLCNNKLHGYSGVIESPNFPNNYPPNSNCSWIIDAPRGNKVNISFSHFDFEGTTVNDDTEECRYDYVEVKEGTDDVPHTELGKFCQQENMILPPKIASTENQVFINFLSDGSLHYGGFRLEWIVNGCGGHINRPEGTITSPGYPRPYPTDTECEWLIEVDYGQSIQINFTDVNTEKMATCTYDKIELFGGENAQAPKLVEFCHSNGPVVYVSPVNKLFVKFTSDYTYAGRGFSANFKAVPLTCGGVFRADSGVIHSANYPMNYPNSQNCEWLIEVDKHHVVNLTFSDFDVEGTPNCTDDYVKVFDGASRDSPVLGTFCRTQLPPPVISSTEKMLVVLRTDSLITAKGFAATFSRACGARIVTNETGVLTTASDLHLQHEWGQNCSWIIAAADLADHITLTFAHMDLSCGYGACDSDCSDHVLEVYEGEGTDGPLRGRWCDNKSPPPIVSTGNALTVHLATFSYTEVTFAARYSALNSACGGDYHTEAGTIASPGYPNSYPLNAECTWILQTAPGNAIQVIFSKFDIETSPNCDRDYLEVREESAVGQLIGVFCGSQIDVINSNKKLWMKFRSDEVGTGEGFVAEYTFQHGSELTAPTGVIASPLYPYPFTKYTTVNWRITVEHGYLIRIEFDDFHVDNIMDDCDWNYGFKIYDGYDGEAPLLHQFCGSTMPESFQSTSNMVYIAFEGDNRRLGNWFHLHYYQIPRITETSEPEVVELSDCNVEIAMTNLENSSHFLSSPGYPDGYANMLHCNWLFTSPPGSHLVLRFLNIDLEESHSCMADSVSVYSGYALAKVAPPEAKLLGKFCLTNESHAQIEGSNVMTVKFESDMYINRTGFKAIAYRECGGQLTGPNGVIHFNDTVREKETRAWNYNCEWNVTVRAGRTIEATIVAMSIEATTDHGCGNYYLLLKNGHGPEAPLLGDGKYCGQNPPDPLTTTSNRLYVKVVGSGNRAQFKLTYREVGMDCGGTFQLSKDDMQQEFKTPRYPNMPPPYSECFWSFMAPPDQRMALHFLERFDLTASPNCEKEYVEVRDGGTDSSKLLGTYCRDTAPSTLTTTGNMLYVHYYTEMADPGNGFKAIVTTGDICGGILRGRQGTVTSPNYPALYPKDQECAWWIVGPPDHTLKLEFRDLHLPGLRRCDQTDHVVIHERAPNNVTTRELVTVCGSTKPEVIETAFNEALITFYSYNKRLVNFRGFSLNFTSSKEACGGSLTGTEGMFHSLGYPNPTSRSIYCDWRIEVPEGSQVKLEILDFDAGAEDNEHGFYLAFYNDFQSRSKIAVIRNGQYRDTISSSSNFMLVSYWSTSGHRGLSARFTAVPPAPCGGVVEATSGSLAAPTTPPFNNASYYCSWTLRAPQDYAASSWQSFDVTLTVTIRGLIGRQARQTRACRYQMKYITLSDGDSLIGAVCGNATLVPFVLRSPSPVNNVRILNGTYGPSMNFNLEYSWSKCGGVLTGPSHTVRAPSDVVVPRSCAWNVKYPEGQAIRMTFNRLNIGPCEKGYIVVRNGGPQSPEVGKFCGNIKPRNITSSSHRLWIEYYAAELPGDFEFQLDLVSGGCGGSAKEISSPGFPQLYPNNSECIWEMTAEPGYHIGLSFVERFNLETSTNCANDYVQVFDWDIKANGSWRSLAKVCGRNLPESVNATSNRMKVVFRTNEAIRGEGFKAHWEKNCGGIFPATAYRQYLESPNYPNFYARNLNCNYTIVAPPGKVILLEFDEFQLEGGPFNCKYDNLSITRNEYSWRNEEDVFCGDNKPPVQISLEKITIIFKTDQYVQKRGFQLKYFLSDCGGEITEEQTIQPPITTDASQYFARLNCTWVIRAPSDRSVTLRFEFFELEYSRRCFYDRLVIYEGAVIDPTKIRANLCGNLTENLPTVRSAENVMTVNFRSDASNHFRGFKAMVLFTKSVAAGCGGTINLTNSQSWRTQKGPTYDNFDDCMWTVVTAPAKTVQVMFTSFHVNCSGDYLEIRDGLGPFAEVIGKYCGDTLPPPITSSRNFLWIRFYSDGEYTAGGVAATLQAVPSPCGESLIRVDNKTVTIKSPNYPAPYPLGLHCKWTIVGPNGIDLHVHFTDVDMENDRDCAGDALQLTDKMNNKHINQDFGEDLIINGKTGLGFRSVGNHNPTASYKLCGHVDAYDYYTGDNEVEIALKTTQSDPTKPRRFQFDVSVANCTRNYTSQQGRIVHQGFTNCRYTITVPEGRTISLYFLSLRIFDQSDCPRSYLRVYDGDFGGPVLATLCGITVPSPIFSSGNKLSLISNSDKSVTWENYDIIYTSTEHGRGCGGKIYNYAGKFTSPMYPNNYRNASTCTWEISVPRGFKVLLDFGFFDLGSSETCETDHLTIRDVDGDMITESTYCGGERPARYKSQSNEVTVTYVTSVNNGGNGWVINFEAVEESFDESDSELTFANYNGRAYPFGHPVSIPRFG